MAPRLGLRRLVGTGMERAPERYCPVMDSGQAAMSAGVPCATTWPPCIARSRPDIDHVISTADGVLVVLDHDDGVAEVAQMFERLDETLVITLMQADGRLVKDVEHAHEARADLRCQADALCLAAGECGRGPVEREVIEADVDEEPQTRTDLLDDGLSDESLYLRHLDVFEEFERTYGRELRGFEDVLVGYGHGQHFGFEAAAIAGVAGIDRHELLKARPRAVAVAFVVLAHDGGEHALPAREPVGVASVARDVVDADLLVAQAVEQGVAGLLGEILPGRRHIATHVLTDGGIHLRVVVARGAEQRDGAFVRA